MIKDYLQIIFHRTSYIRVKYMYIRDTYLRTYVLTLNLYHIDCIYEESTLKMH